MIAIAVFFTGAVLGAIGMFLVMRDDQPAALPRIHQCLECGILEQNDVPLSPIKGVCKRCSDRNFKSAAWCEKLKDQGD